MAMDCTLGDSGQTKGKPVGRCRGLCRPGQTHHGGFQDLVKQKQGCPDVVLGVVLLQGESWIQWPSFKPKFSYLSVFPYWKAQVFWGTQIFLNMLPSKLTRIFYQDLNESQQNKQATLDKHCDFILATTSQQIFHCSCHRIVESTKSSASNDFQRSLTWFPSPDTISS